MYILERILFKRTDLDCDMMYHIAFYSMESLSGHLKSVGKDMSIIDDKYKDAIFGMGTTLDIVTLQCPIAKNNYVGVSLYCDANGIAKEFKPNTRATRIAQACGHTVVINGNQIE